MVEAMQKEVGLTCLPTACIPGGGTVPLVARLTDSATGVQASSALARELRGAALGRAAPAAAEVDGACTGFSI